MKPVYVEHGEKPEDYKLKRALLLYQSANGYSHYASTHAIRTEGGHPVIGEGKPLSEAALRDVLAKFAGMRGLGGWICPEILYLDRDMIVWHRPPAPRSVFFKAEKPIGKRSAITPQPHLVFAARRHGWNVVAITGTPGPDARVFHAPHWNVYDGGSICTGNVTLPSQLTPATVKGFEDAFFDSYFTHTNNPKSTSHPKGPAALWTELLDGQHAAFPTQYLTPMNCTLEGWVRRLPRGYL